MTSFFIPRCISSPFPITGIQTLFFKLGSTGPVLFINPVDQNDHRALKNQLSRELSVEVVAPPKPDERALSDGEYLNKTLIDVSS